MPLVMLNVYAIYKTQTMCIMRTQIMPHLFDIYTICSIIIRERNIHTISVLCERKGCDTMLTKEAREARNAYRRKWYKEHREQCKETAERYWARKAEQAKQAAAVKE